LSHQQQDKQICTKTYRKMKFIQPYEDNAPQGDDEDEKMFFISSK